MKFTDEIRSEIIGMIEQDYSPEQVAGVLKKNGGTTISHERIYQFIWKNKKQKGTLHTHLRRKGRRYRKRGSSKDSRGKIVGRIAVIINWDEVNHQGKRKVRFGWWDVIDDIEVTTVPKPIQAPAPITVFPWIEDFEDGGAAPTDWSELNVTGSAFWQFLEGNGNTNPLTAHSGTYNACFRDESFASDKAKLITPSVRKEIVERFSAAKKRAVFLDYDGTLVGFKNDPQAANPDNALHELITKLEKDKRNTVTIISGRDRDTLEKWLGNHKVNLIVEHGVWLKNIGEEWQMVDTINNDWKPLIQPILETYVDRTPGTFIEEKNYSLVWHYRKSEPEQGALRANELKDELTNLSWQHFCHP